MGYPDSRFLEEVGDLTQLNLNDPTLLHFILPYRFSLTLVQIDAVEGRWRSRQVIVALYDTETSTPITDVPKAKLSSTSPHPREREISIRLTITNPNPPTRAFLIVKDADDESELLRETWTISLGITKDFGDF
jgi:hypothetical protein